MSRESDHSGLCEKAPIGSVTRQFRCCAGKFDFGVRRMHASYIGTPKSRHYMLQTNYS